MTNRKKLIVSGCSMTHGAELFHPFMHQKNIELSYSRYISDLLDCDLINVALSGGSNEYIFHSIIEALNKNQNIHSVIVMWTTFGRLYWKNNDRHYFITSNYASSMLSFNEGMKFETIGNKYKISSDAADMVSKLDSIYKFLITDYFSTTEENKKLIHYKTALTSICATKQIKIIHLDWSSTEITKSCMMNGKHPTINEHKEIAKIIYKRYYETF